MRALPFSSFISIVLCSVMAVIPVWGQVPDSLQIQIVNADSLKAVSHASETENLTVQVTDAAGVAVADAAVTCRLPDSGATGTFSDGSHATVAYTDAQGRAKLDSFHWGSVPGAVAVRFTANKGTAHAGILVQTTVADASSTKAVEKPAVSKPAVAATPVISEPAVSVTVPGKATTPAQPGQLASATPVVHSSASGVDTTQPDQVSVTRTAASDAPHNSHVKWLVIAALVAAAGAGAAFAMKGKSSASSSTSSAVSIGNPTVSVGQP